MWNVPGSASCSIGTMARFPSLDEHLAALEATANALQPATAVHRQLTRLTSALSPMRPECTASDSLTFGCVCDRRKHSNSISVAAT
jgi:hypothetical protein